ncbi:ARM repeat-containing protein [Thelephora ganbajun]|uniref:ARM repeat-containing protein n=1 Tax=Thelephora ganbajun TaxID=370292 RepID=A0ACB6ZHQ8_THEGA|nr:ARM repeat-containing protein [Thelephora ganbajun]
MPRENRKRGKKYKKPVQNKPEPEADPDVHQEDADYEGDQETGNFGSGDRPSWVVREREPQVNLEAPFGYVDADVKAYFRTVELQIRDWQENPAHGSSGYSDANEHEQDPNEDRRLFLSAALQEMSGKELQLATDPDCSGILERMAYSMDDFTRRVFMDRLAGSYEQLSTHRFASHVCQTVLTVASETIAREARGNMPTVDPEQGELRTITQLVSDAAEELLPSLSSLVMDQFASHVVRILLVLFSPHLFPPDFNTIRSKRSSVWKSSQGTMKSVFASQGGPQGGKSALKAHTIPEFSELARRFVQQLRKDLDANEVRALAANKVASPVLQMLIEIEADQGMSDLPESLMDRALMGLITLHREDPSRKPEASDFLGTLLRDATSSHLLETLVTKSSPPIFRLLWSTYFQQQLPRLSVHPVANFVVARALSRIDQVQLGGVCEELGKSWQKIIKSSRVGIVKALVDRAVTLDSREGDLVEAVCSAFELKTPEDRVSFVPCVLHLATLSEHQARLKQPTPQGGLESSGKQKKLKRLPNSQPGTLQPQTQGALLLSSMMHMAYPHNSVLLESINSLSIPDLITMAHHPTSSRVLDAIFESSTVSQRARNKFVLRFVGHLHELVDDKFGSRVGDRLWAGSDPYLKEKIAKSLQLHEQSLAGSQYGKYFVRNMNLLLLKRDPDAWRAQQSSRGKVPISSTSGQTKSISSISTAEKPSEQPSAEAPPKLISKRKRKEGDDIDKVFDSTLGKKQKRSALPPAREEPNVFMGYDATGLEGVLGAIKDTPTGDKDRRHKKKKAR